jgi:hypothetical protein
LKFRQEMLDKAVNTVQERLKIISLVLNLDENKAISTRENVNTNGGSGVITYSNLESSIVNPRSRARSLDQRCMKEPRRTKSFPCFFFAASEIK